MTKRKSCPIKKRDFIKVTEFNKANKILYDGTETVRELNKFDKEWFYCNSIIVISVSKGLYGKTYVIPYKDINGIRYWLQK